ncbi:MAG: biotin/lipoyl-binding protein, partial [Gemmatimonadetes bacterium]|nr:biotin/lipoyl-binding protein [Gemmatimonadota bacterium]
MRKLGTRGIVAAIATLSLLLGGSAALRSSEAAAPDAAREAVAADNPSSRSFPTDVAIPVEGRPATRGTLVISVSAAGQAEAWRKTVVAAQVGGRIASLPVRESQGVGAGTPLVALDAAEFGLAVEDAEAALRDAQAKYRELTVFDDRIADEGVRRD